MRFRARLEIDRPGALSTIVAIVVAQVLAVAVVRPLHATAQTRDDRLAAIGVALRNHDRPPAGDTAIRRTLVVMSRRVGGDIAAIDTQRIILTRTALATVLETSSFVMRSDEAHTIREDPRARVLHVFDHNRERKLASAQKRMQQGLPDSLIARSRLASWAAGDAGGFSAVLILDSAYRRFANADSVALDVDGTGEIRRLTVWHPGSSGAASTTFELHESVVFRATEVLLRPAWQHYFTESGAPLPAFASYRVLGRRGPFMSERP